jgi:hypothetical protein
VGVAYAAKVQSASLKAGVMLGALVKVGKKVGIVIRKLKYGWVVRWNNGKKEIISWNTKERRWKAREKDVTVLARMGKEYERSRKKD